MPSKDAMESIHEMDSSIERILEMARGFLGIEMNRWGQRWQSKDAAKFVATKDSCQFPVTFMIEGSIDDTEGNPVPYERMTQRGKFKDPRDARYLAWLTYVRQCWMVQVGQELPQERDGHYRLDVHCYFAGERHADPDNVRKGIQDALFGGCGDKHVTGEVTCQHVTRSPHVTVCVDKLTGK